MTDKPGCEKCAHLRAELYEARRERDELRRELDQRNADAAPFLAAIEAAIEQADRERADREREGSTLQ